MGVGKECWGVCCTSRGGGVLFFFFDEEFLAESFGEVLVDSPTVPGHNRIAQLNKPNERIPGTYTTQGGVAELLKKEHRSASSSKDFSVGFHDMDSGVASLVHFRCHWGRRCFLERHRADSVVFVHSSDPDGATASERSIPIPKEPMLFCTFRVHGEFP